MAAEDDDQLVLIGNVVMPETEKEDVKIKSTASMLKTSIKRVYTICNVLEAMRLMVRMGRNNYEWQ